MAHLHSSFKLPALIVGPAMTSGDCSTEEFMAAWAARASGWGAALVNCSDVSACGGSGEHAGTQMGALKVSQEIFGGIGTGFWYKSCKIFINIALRTVPWPRDVEGCDCGGGGSKGAQGRRLGRLEISLHSRRERASMGRMSSATGCSDGNCSAVLNDAMHLYEAACAGKREDGALSSKNLQFHKQLRPLQTGKLASSASGKKRSERGQLQCGVPLRTGCIKHVPYHRLHNVTFARVAC